MRHTKRMERAESFGRWAIVIRQRLAESGGYVPSAQSIAAQLSALTSSARSASLRGSCTQQSKTQKARAAGVYRDLARMAESLGWWVDYSNPMPVMQEIGDDSTCQGVTPAELP